MVLCLLTRIFSPFFPFLSYSLLESWSKRRGAAGPGRMDGRRTFGRRVVNVTARATNSLLLSLSPPSYSPSHKTATHKVKDSKKNPSPTLTVRGEKYTHSILLSIHTHTHTPSRSQKL